MWHSLITPQVVINNSCRSHPRCMVTQPGSFSVDDTHGKSRPNALQFVLLRWNIFCAVFDRHYAIIATTWILLYWRIWVMFCVGAAERAMQPSLSIRNSNFVSYEQMMMTMMMLSRQIGIAASDWRFTNMFIFFRPLAQSCRLYTLYWARYDCNGVSLESKLSRKATKFPLRKAIDNCWNR